MAFPPNDLVVIVGLGNPGPAYEATRHNIGFMTADELAGNADIPLSFRLDKKTKALAATGLFQGHRVIIAKPQTFMNLSGDAVGALCRFYKVQPDHLIVVHDELDVELGAVRLKRGGGDNGHNGLKSITSRLGTNDYYRVRVGIGRPPGRKPVADWVLTAFSRRDEADVAAAVANAADAVGLIITDDLPKAQNSIHARR